MWVVAPKQLEAQVRRLLPELRADNLIIEPSPRDTAPAVALACASVARADPSAVTGIFPTDHVIGDEQAYFDSVRRASAAAGRGDLICLGIRPDRPATGFGYLECAHRPSGKSVVDVKRFVEKPDLSRARRFLSSGRYLWNAGMFVWQAKRFLEELERTAPEILHAVEGHLDGRRGAWGRATRRSVDFAVMEQARGVRVVPLQAGWDDVGSWDAAGRLREQQGIVDDKQILVDSPGSVVFGGKRVVALVDVPGVVVVDTGDALLVVSREDSEKVRQVVERLRESGATKLL
jgi:mannose-1-phosphate guanylyltransferase